MIEKDKDNEFAHNVLGVWLWVLTVLIVLIIIVGVT